MARLGAVRTVTGKYLSTSGQVKASAGVVVNLTAIATATAGYVQLRDGGGSGTVLYRVETPATAGQSVCVYFGEADGLRFLTDIYLELSNAAASVAYE